MQRFLLIAALACGLGWGSFPRLAAQTASDLSRPRVAGMAVASQYGRWSAAADGPADHPIVGGGVPAAAVLQSGAFTLPDGTAFLPLAVGTPLAIGGDAHPETVIPTAVACGMGSGSCSFTAIFAFPHAGHFRVSSATLGLQEAINAMASRGGVVLADAGLTGTVTSVLAQLTLPANVLLVDQTAGHWTYYGRGAAGATATLASFSSTAGTSIGALASLNGAQFVSAHNFGPVAAEAALDAATPATLTPAWDLPGGVVAGDSLYVSGGLGTPEVVTLSNVGSACPNGSAASICFTPAHNHSGAFTLQSATAGVQEAINAAGPGGWVMDDLPAASLLASVVISQPLRLTGFSAMDANIGTQLDQTAPNQDVIQIGTSALAPSDVMIENLMAVGFNGSGSDSGVAIHCLNCAKLKLVNVTAKQAHDGLYFDSTYGHAFDATVTASHFIGNYYGIHIVGSSANRLTFVGNTSDANVYGVFDDGGWVHTWIGNDFESNTKYGYWQQVSQPGSYSGHNVVLHGNYFENNGANTAGQGDLFLGQLLGGGSGNNGSGCIDCEVIDNLFNAASGGNVTAVNFGAVSATASDNTYSGYGAGNTYAYATGPAPNYAHVLSLGDGGGDTGATAASGAYGGSRPGTLSRIDNNGGLTLGGWDQLNDIHGSPLRDTTIESPTGEVSVRGVPGGTMASNPANLMLDGNSTAQRGNSIWFRNQTTPEYQINNDPFGSNAHDFCLLNDLANPSAAQCLAYVNPQGKMKFGNPGPPGTLATRTQDYQFTQTVNGDSALVVNRATDASPTGYLLDLEDATLSTPLFRIDTHGTVVAGSWNNSSSAITVGPINATTGSFSGIVSAATGSTVGGAAINTTAPRLGAQSGMLFASSTFAAGQCLTGGVSFGSGVALGMAVSSNPEAVPPSGLVWNAVIDAANHVTIRVCNATAASINWSSGAVWDARVLP